MMSSQSNISIESGLRPTLARISREALRANLKFLQSLTLGEEFFCPMIKAEAYGHGDLEVAKILTAEGVQNFGVALIEEGLRLRKSGVKESIFVYAAFSDADSAQAILRACLTPVVSDWEQLEVLNTHATAPISIHLEFDTGMNRLGFSVSESEKLKTWFADHPKLVCRGLMTHMHSCEDMANSGNLQLLEFSKTRAFFSEPSLKIHTLNCGGLLRRVQNPSTSPSEVNSGVRPGLCLYGLAPFSDASELTNQLRPVMRLESKIVQLKKVPIGGSVSYGATWKAKRDSTIGVIPVGYGDGYPRHLSNRGQVQCRGHLIPIVGIVCMDYLMVDLTDLKKEFVSDALLGEKVILFGDQVRAEQLAENAQTIPYEIVTRISGRVPRLYE